jgi:hypothetical protein
METCAFLLGLAFMRIPSPARREFAVVAELDDRHALDQFHDEERPAISGDPPPPAAFLSLGSHPTDESCGTGVVRRRLVGLLSGSARGIGHFSLLTYIPGKANAGIMPEEAARKPEEVQDERSP